MVRLSWLALFLLAVAAVAKEANQIGLGRKLRARFGSAEHMLVADTAGGLAGVLMIPSKNGPPFNVTIADLGFENAAGLFVGTYATIVTYADYFGATSLEQAVCLAETAADQQAAFQTAFDLVWQTDDHGYLNTIAGEIDLEQNAVGQAVASGADPSGALWDLSLTRYLAMLKSLDIGLYNVDHFAERGCALQAYLAGHYLAQQTARAAGALVQTSFDAGYGLLMQAYAMNAFADHFLTDLFSTGHIRTPRQTIVSACAGNIVSSAVTVLRMHNEESYNGVQVVNARGDVWTAYGDYFLFDAKSAQHLAVVREAAEISRAEIWQAFQGSSIGGSGAVALVPSPADGDPRNTCPIYSVAGGELMVRSPISEPSSPARVFNLTGGSGVPGCGSLSPTASTQINCTYAAFAPAVDCFGYSTWDDLLTAADLLFYPPAIQYDSCSLAYVSYSHLNNAGHTPTPSALLPLAGVLALLSVWFQ